MDIICQSIHDYIRATPEKMPKNERDLRKFYISDGLHDIVKNSKYVREYIEYLIEGQKNGQ